MNSEKFNQVAKDFGPGLYRLSFKMLCNKEAAKDMVQETFTKLWENRNKVNLEKVKSWLFTTIYRLCLKNIEESKKYTTDDCLITFATKDHPPYDLQQILTESLDLLSDIQRSVLLLRDYEGYDYKEIAEILQINDAQARMHLFRARQKLKVYLKQIEYII